MLLLLLLFYCSFSSAGTSAPPAVQK